MCPAYLAGGATGAYTQLVLSRAPSLGRTKMGTQVGDAGGLDTPSQRRRFSRSENGSGNGHGPTLSQTVATEVRGLLDASEAAARAIKDRAASEAEELRQALIAE